MRYVVDLKKAQPTQSEEGILTQTGMGIAHSYAVDWVKGARNLIINSFFTKS